MSIGFTTAAVASGQATSGLPGNASGALYDDYPTAAFENVSFLAPRSSAHKKQIAFVADGRVGSNGSEDDDTYDAVKALDRTIDELEEVEIEADVFLIPSVLRSDVLLLIGGLVETVLIILAVQSPFDITHPSSTLFVVPLLAVFVFINSQVRYAITHWTRRMALVRRRIARYERERAIEEQRRRGRHAAPKRVRSDPGVRFAYSPAGITLANVRLASSEMTLTFVSNILYLVNTYLKYLLISIIMGKINANFSDGLFSINKAVVLIEIVMPFYVVFGVAGYRQDVVAKSIRFGQ